MTSEELAGLVYAGVLSVVEFVEGNTGASIGVGSRRVCDCAGDTINCAGSRDGGEGVERTGRVNGVVAAVVGPVAFRTPAENSRSGPASGGSSRGSDIVPRVNDVARAGVTVSNRGLGVMVGDGRVGVMVGDGGVGVTVGDSGVSVTVGNNMAGVTVSVGVMIGDGRTGVDVTVGDSRARIGVVADGWAGLDENATGVVIFPGIAGGGVADG